MNTEELALVAFVIFFVFSFIVLLRRDTFIAGVYFFLFVYIIFAQLSYYYYPELSARIGAYFGQPLFLFQLMFVGLSFLVFFIVVVSSLSLSRGISYRTANVRVPAYGRLFCLLVFSHLLWMALFFGAKYDELSYATASDEAFVTDQGVPYLLFVMAFKFSVAVILVLYALMRLRREVLPTFSRTFIPFFLMAELILFVWVATRLANRTDVLALALGLCMFEYKLGGGLRKVAHITICLGAVFYGLILIESTRFIEPIEQLFHEALLLKDYFAPAHILFAVIHYDVIDPAEAFTSNILNALVLFGYPYLQATITELFNPGVTTRVASYAFYVFSEGYIVLGPLGFLYNGVVVGLGVLLWRSLAGSDNRAYNIFMLALLSTQMATIVRGQTSYFFKDLYIYFFPAMLLFFLASGIRLAILPLRRTRCSQDLITYPVRNSAPA